MKTGKTEKHHMGVVYTVLSFFVLRFHNGIWKWGNQVYFSFFLNSKTEKGYRNMILYIYFHFSFASSKKARKTTPSVYAVLCCPVWCHSFGKTNKEPNRHLFVFRLATIRKHKWDLHPSDVLWYLCSLYKTLTKARKTFV